MSSDPLPESRAQGRISDGSLYIPATCSACADADFAIHNPAEVLSLPIVRHRPRPVVTVESLTPHEDGNEDRY
jgi:hypothetical protein